MSPERLQSTPPGGGGAGALLAVSVFMRSSRRSAGRKRLDARPLCDPVCDRFQKRAILHPMQHTTSRMRGLLPGRTTLSTAALGSRTDSELPGGAHLVPAQGVVRLDPEPAVSDVMLEGWARQQRSRFLNFDATVKPRLAC
ncbi:hypothetical protein GCM10010207_49140 [Streptomyces atratus]|nr:hypothetical protein GCM10010207_49140 [Streptomyces atratus]